MELVFGARGTLDLDLTVYGPVKGLHDGHYGNWVPNPIVRLTHLIDSMRDENGRILIKGFYDQVRAPTSVEKEALAKIPDVEAELRREFQIGSTEGNGKALNELLMLPGLNLRGIESGHVGTQASNTIPTEAHASIDFRLVPDETPESIKPLVERHLEAQGYAIVRELPDTAARLAKRKARESGLGLGLSAFPDFSRSAFLSRARKDHDRCGARAGAPANRRRQPANGSFPAGWRRPRNRFSHREPR